MTGLSEVIQSNKDNCHDQVDASRVENYTE